MDKSQTNVGIAATMALGWIVAQGCRFTEVDKTHCNFNQGDSYCADKYPDGEYPFCESGMGGCVSPQKTFGCVAERPSDECYSPCGGLTTIEEDGSCLGEESSSSGSSGSDTSSSDSGSSDETTMGTTGPMPCVDNEDCTDAAAPFCEPVSGECVACDAFGAEADAACAGLDPMAPLCVNGACVACTPENPVVCDDQLLLCDGGTNTCIQCTEHAQCGSGACELALGRCFPDDFVVHVDGDGGQDYMSIAAAVDAVDDGMHGVIVVHELDMDASYQAAVTIDGTKTIALLTAPGEAPRIQGTGGNPGLRVEGAGTILYMDGLRLRNGDVQGLLVDGAFAWVDRSRIVQNSGGGVLAQGGAELTLRNCFVGGSADDVDAVTIDGATTTVLYTTIGGGNGAFDMARALSCTTGSDVTIRNSILAALDDVPELACSMATVSYSASETAIAGTANVTLGPVQGGWFANYSTGDFDLAAPPASITTAAQWQAGDPVVDIDGDARPGIDGFSDVAGADVP